VPNRQTQELRGLLRTRKQKVRERGRNTQRLQKTLEEANIKLDSVISNVIGVSGRRSGSCRCRFPRRWLDPRAR
jgi:transposase